MSIEIDSDIRYIPNETIHTLQLSKLHISQEDTNKIHALGLSPDDKQILVSILFYLRASGLHQRQNMLMMSIDILAHLKHPNSLLDIEDIKKNINKYSACMQGNIGKNMNGGSKELKHVEESLRNTIKETIAALQNMKTIILTLQKHTNITLSSFNAFIQQHFKDLSIPDLTDKVTTFKIYLSYINYSLLDKTAVNDQIIDMQELYTHLLDIIHTSLKMLHELIQLDHISLQKKLQEYKTMYVKPTQLYIDGHEEKITDVFYQKLSTKYISDLFATQLKHFIFNIPIFSYRNMFQRQLHLQQRLQSFLQTTHHLCSISPFVIKVDIELSLLHKIYTFDINLHDILDILDCKRRHSTFTLDTFFQTIVSSEINEYVKDPTSTSTLGQTLQNALYELALCIFNEIIPTFNTLEQSSHIVLTQGPTIQTAASYKDTMKHTACNNSSEVLNSLLGLLQAPKAIPNAIDTLLSHSDIDIDSFISNSNMILFHINSVETIPFIRLLDFFLGICSTGVIQSFGVLPDNVSFMDIVSKHPGRHFIHKNASRSPDLIPSSIRTSYYLESTCTPNIIDYIQRTQPHISPDIINMHFM